MKFGVSHKIQATKNMKINFQMNRIIEAMFTDMFELLPKKSIEMKEMKVFTFKAV